jgi:probable F420-dependent oxidoreductase
MRWTPFVATGFAAAHTTTMRLIPSVVVLPDRNPLLVAKAGATLDLLSGGRLTLAVGVGYLKHEFIALGLEFDDRAALVEEALQVIRAIWTTDDVSFEGESFTATGITAHPRPASPPPIWIGGNTAASRRCVRRRSVPVPGDSLAHTQEAIAQFGEQVIAKL